jgi:hypothetical protein
LGAVGTASIVVLFPPVIAVGSFAPVAYLIATSLWAPFGLFLWAKKPEHPMGPLITVTGIASLCVIPGFYMGGFFEQFDTLFTPQPWVMVLSLGVAGAYTFLTVLAILLFPEGRPQTRFRKWLVRLVLVFMAGATVAGLLAEPLGPTQHPFAAPDLAASAREIWLASQNLYGLMLVVAVVLKVVDYRRAESERKSQLKWLVYVLALYLISTIWTFGVVGLENITIWHLLLDPLFLGLIGVAMTLAVLRYRLYDIDKIVSRTVSYALIVAIVAAVFALPVVLLPGLINASNDLIVATATLAAAAVFNPVRRRVQTWVDRRFNRGKYDADKEVSNFARSLATTTDANVITGDTIDLVSRILQPATVGMWVKE